MLVYRYSRWNSAQEIFPLDEEDLMDQLADQMMASGDVASSLRTMMQRGLQGKEGQRVTGLPDLLQQLRDQRQEATDRYKLGSVLNQIKQQIQEIVAQERQGIENRLQAVQERFRQLKEQGSDTTLEEQLLRQMERRAAQNQESLDQLPPDSAGQVRRLQEYEFMDSKAKERFDQLLQSLQRQVLDAHLQQLSQALQNLTPQDLQATREFLQDLNSSWNSAARAVNLTFSSSWKSGANFLAINSRGAWRSF
ncbi:MAG: hypothetical protein EXR55_02850 [Dehalococcoidia bacterium]|nr:hypothetical protein [Dehalococcoidia bacterium]